MRRRPTRRQSIEWSATELKADKTRRMQSDAAHPLSGLLMVLLFLCPCLLQPVSSSASPRAHSSLPRATSSCRFPLSCHDSLTTLQLSSSPPIHDGAMQYLWRQLQSMVCSLSGCALLQSRVSETGLEQGAQIFMRVRQRSRASNEDCARFTVRRPRHFRLRVPCRLCHAALGALPGDALRPHLRGPNTLTRTITHASSGVHPDSNYKQTAGWRRSHQLARPLMYVRQRDDTTLLLCVE